MGWFGFGNKGFEEEKARIEGAILNLQNSRIKAPTLNDLPAIEGILSGIVDLRSSIDVSPFNDEFRKRGLYYNYLRSLNYLLADFWNACFLPFEREIKLIREARFGIRFNQEKIMELLERAKGTLVAHRTASAFSNQKIIMATRDAEFRLAFRSVSGMTGFEEKHKYLLDSLNSEISELEKYAEAAESNVIVEESKSLEKSFKEFDDYCKRNFINVPGPSIAPLHEFIYIAFLPRAMENISILMDNCNGFMERTKVNERRDYWNREKVSQARASVSMVLELLGKLKSSLQFLADTYSKHLELYSKGFATHASQSDNVRNILKTGFIGSQTALVEEAVKYTPVSKSGIERVLPDISLSIYLEPFYGEVVFLFKISDIIRDYNFYERKGNSGNANLYEIHLFSKNGQSGVYLPIEKAIMVVPKEPSLAEASLPLKDYYAKRLEEDQWNALIEMINSRGHEGEMACFPSQGELNTGKKRWLSTEVNIDTKFQPSREKMVGIANGLWSGSKSALQKAKSLERAYRQRLKSVGILRVSIMGANRPLMTGYQYWTDFIRSVALEESSWLHGKDVEAWIKTHVMPYDASLIRYFKSLQFYQAKVHKEGIEVWQRFIRRSFAANKITIADVSGNIQPVGDSNNRIVSVTTPAQNTFYLFRYMK